MQKKVGEVFETYDYSMFKKTEWNRNVTEPRIRKITESIEKHGYILNPICVNENYEVIDGQGRLEALKLLGMPVHFYINPGAGKEDCVALNSYNTLWSMYDYICSHASTGSDDYIRIKDLVDRYMHPFGLDAVMFATAGLVGIPKSQIKSGDLKCSAEQYSDGMKRLEKLKEFETGVSKIPGNQKKVYQAVLFAMGLDETKIDLTKLRERIELRYSKAPTVSTMNDALVAISTIYDIRSRDEPVHLEIAYDKYMRGKYLWYGKRYGKTS